MLSVPWVTSTCVAVLRGDGGAQQLAVGIGDVQRVLADDRDHVEAERDAELLEDAADLRLADLEVRLVVEVDLVDGAAGGDDAELVHRRMSPGVRGAIIRPPTASGVQPAAARRLLLPKRARMPGQLADSTITSASAISTNAYSAPPAASRRPSPRGRTRPARTRRPRSRRVPAAPAAPAPAAAGGSAKTSSATRTALASARTTATNSTAKRQRAQHARSDHVRGARAHADSFAASLRHAPAQRARELRFLVARLRVVSPPATWLAP